MRKIKAFFIALVLCIGTVWVAKGHYDNVAKEALNNNSIRYDISFAKFKSHNILVNNIDDTTLTVMGSSELSRITGSKQHPKNAIDFQDLKYMTIGQGYFQSILHTVTLGSIDEGIKNRKVVLFLSPQWFDQKGIRKEAFASRYSEDHMIYFLKNQHITKETKEKVINRVTALLKDNKDLIGRLDKYKKMYVDNDIEGYDKYYISAFSSFINEKYEYEYLFNFKENKRINDKKYDPNKIDFSSLKKEGEEKAKKSCTNNDFGIRDDYWNAHIKKRFDKLKDSHKDIKYKDSIEYNDLQLFLDVAKELGIKVELVNQPVNGPWYDYMGHSKEDREAYYQNIRNIANKNNVELLDLSNYEYEPYFFMDATHFGWKGWAIINEELLKFYQE